MPTESRQSDAVMMAWYRAKKFGLVRPLTGALPNETVAASLMTTGSTVGRRQVPSP